MKVAEFIEKKISRGLFELVDHSGKFENRVLLSCQSIPEQLYTYSGTSISRTLMARLPRLFRTRS